MGDQNDPRLHLAAQAAIVDAGRKLVAAVQERERISSYRLREANGEITHNEFGQPSERGELAWIGQPTGYQNRDVLMLVEGYAALLREEIATYQAIMVEAGERWRAAR